MTARHPHPDGRDAPAPSAPPCAVPLSAPAAPTAPGPPPAPPPASPASPPTSPRARAPHPDRALLPAVHLPQRVRIVEVGPRDGLQNESVVLSTSDKLWLIRSLAAAGLSTVEATSFVSVRRVPQLADHASVMRALATTVDTPGRPTTAFPVLVPNARGLAAALAAGARDLAVFAAATDAFSRANLNCDRLASLARFRPLVAAARARGLRVRAYVSCVVGCPYEGAVDPVAVADMARALHDMGCAEIALGDTIGVGNPCSVARVVDAVVARGGVPVERLAIHCHDTRGTALANVLAALSRGVAVVDASVAGLGGCPFAPGAAGNLATEDVVHMLRGMDVDIGPVRLDRLLDIGRAVCAKLGKQTSSRVAQAAAKRPDAKAGAL